MSAGKFRRKIDANKILAGLATLSITLSFLSAMPASATVQDLCPAGVTKAGAAPASEDIEVTSYSIYCVAKFKTVANDYLFTVPAGITKIDYLVVGGGGGGASGGGGAGGVLKGNDYSVSSGTQLAISVGAGGAGGTGGNGPASFATKGTQSAFEAVIALGGGRGGAGNVASDVSGASGGGSRFDCTESNCGSGFAGTGVFGQGNNGGYSTYNSYGGGAGGGGAGGAGLNTTRQHIGGAGGSGIASDISGIETFYGGGGGGGVNQNSNTYMGVALDNNLTSEPTPGITNTGGGKGGLGGGGQGSAWGCACNPGDNMANATAGAPNTGGGGGGTDPEDSGAGAGGSGVVIVRWISNANLKSVTFNPNTTELQASTQLVGSGVSTALRANSFTRTGFVFMGWTVAQDGTGSVYEDGSAFTTSADAVLYAKWAAGVTRTVTFDANGGTGTMATQTAGTSVGLTPNAFSRSGYTFDGWKTVSSGTGFTYGNGSIYSFQADTTLFAQWKTVVPTFKVTFYGNAANGGTTASQSASSSTALGLNGFTRTGYNFLGWDTNYSSNSAPYLDGQNYSFTSDLNLYAIWVAQANNNLIYDGNGATTGSTASQTASTGTMVTANGFALAGSTFRNWNTSANGTGVTYQSNYVYSFAVGRTLYAQWGLNYTVAYDANTADSGTVPIAQSSFVGSPGVNLSLNTGNLRKVGYRLSGWNANPDGTGTPYALGASSVAFSGDKTIYAQWTPAIYSVIYAPNGALTGVEPAAVTFTNGQAITVAPNSGALEKPGYTFDGWSTDPNASVPAFQPAANETLSQDTVFFAFWRATAPLPSAGSGSGGGSSSSSPDTQATPTPTPTPTPTSPPTVKLTPLAQVVLSSAKKTGTPVLAGTSVTMPIIFAANSSRLDAGDMAILRKLVATLPSAKGVLTITGFVSSRGKATASGLKLATARAKAVALALTQIGIDVQIGYAGYGSRNRILPTATDRRVEIRWVADK